MNATRLMHILFLILLPTVEARRQDENAAQGKKTRAMVRLLPGYKFQIVPGFEGNAAGTLWKEGGPKIEFTLGCCFDDATQSTRREDVLWKEEQVVNGRTFICAYTKSRELLMSFPKQFGYFRAKVQSQRDLSEVLLMVLTFDLEHGYPVDPRMIVPVPENPKSAKNPAN
jgi:hypothetical protein